MKYSIVLGAAFAVLAVAAPAPGEPEPPCTLEICTNPAKEPTQYYQTSTTTADDKNGWVKPTTTAAVTTTPAHDDKNGWGKSTTTSSTTTKKEDKNGWGKTSSTTSAKKTTTKDEHGGWAKPTSTTTSAAGWGKKTTTPAPVKPYTITTTIVKEGKTWVTPVVVTPTAPAAGGDNWNGNGGKPAESPKVDANGKPVAQYTGAAAAQSPLAMSALLGGVFVGAAFLL